MKDVLRQFRRRLRPRRHLRETSVRLLGLEDQPAPRKAVETVVDSSVGLVADGLRRIVLGEDTRLTADTVEDKYDELAGEYIRKNVAAADRRSLYWVEGRLREVTRAEHRRRMLDEYARCLEDVPFETMLEVGAGELTTIAGLARRFGSGREYHAIDLSFDRVHRGVAFFDDRDVEIEAARANAVQLPYADDSFDLVVTSHCLEHMPLDFRDAIDEMVRVARRAVVLFEPSWELAGPVQRLRMRAHGYVRGIDEALRDLGGVRLDEPRLLDNASPFNRTARYGIKLTSRRVSTARTGAPIMACPACSSPLVGSKTDLRCEPCQWAFPIIDGIPDLGPDAAYSVSPPPAASRQASTD